jgi:hypothetical protein
MLAPPVGRTRMADQWICLFLARSGMKARAVFATEEQAKQFAEQHAQVSAPGMPLKWNDSPSRSTHHPSRELLDRSE